MATKRIHETIDLAASVGNIAKGGDAALTGRIDSAHWAIRYLLGGARYNDMTHALTKAFDRVCPCAAYKTATSARNSILHRIASALEALDANGKPHYTDAEKQRVLDAGYADESQNPANKAAKKAAVVSAASLVQAAQDARIADLDPTTAEGCLKRAADLYEKAATLEQSDAVTEQAEFTRGMQSAKKFKSSRATQAAKSA